MAHRSTIELLKAWGNWGRPPNLGYPTMSPMFGERALKTPLYGATYIRPDIAEAECAVCRIPYPERFILIQRYQYHLNLGQLGHLLEVSRWTARRRLADAESSVEIELKYA